MRDLFIVEKNLKKELEEIENEGGILSQKLFLLKQEIQYIFLKIKTSDNIEVANPYFNLLQKIQFTLSSLVYKDNLGLPDIFFWFIKDFDRLDDLELRNYIFRKIKNDEYFFGQQLD